MAFHSLPRDGAAQGIPLAQDLPDSALWLTAVEVLQLNCLLQASPMPGSWPMGWLLLGVLLVTLLLLSLGRAMLLSLVVVSGGVGGFDPRAFRSSKLPGGCAHHLLEVIPLLVVQCLTSEWGKLIPE